MSTISSSLGLLACAAAVFLSGCSTGGSPRGAETAACEKFVQGALRSPSTYARVSATTTDRKITGEDFAFYQVAKGSEGGTPAIRTVLIEYDAANAFGTPVRGNQKCDFLLTDLDNEKFDKEPEVSATLASADRALGQSSECCLPPLTKEANEIFGNMSLETPPLVNEGSP